MYKITCDGTLKSGHHVYKKVFLLVRCPSQRVKLWGSFISMADLGIIVSGVIPSLLRPTVHIHISSPQHGLYEDRV